MRVPVILPPLSTWSFSHGNLIDTDSTSTCTTTTTPATSPTTQIRSIRQENVRAIMTDGTHVTLWCQVGFR